MKLLIIACHPVSYQLPLFCAIEKKLKGLGFSSKVLFLDNFTISKTYFAEINGDLDIEPSIYLSELTHRFSRNLLNGKKSGFFSRVNLDIFFDIISCDYVLLHGYEFFSYFVILLFAKLARKKVIFRGEVTLRYYDPSEPISLYLKIVKIIKHAYVSFFLNSSIIVLYSCFGNKSYFEKFIGFANSKLKPFSCCVDNSLCRSLVSEQVRHSLRQSYGFKDGDLVIGFSGRLTKRKNIDLLLDAVNQVKKRRNTCIQLVLIGNGPEAANLKLKAQSINVNLVITSFLSHRNSLSHLNMLDLFCIPSIYDPSPKSLNEAMNFALPVLVSSACGTAPDLVHPYVNGLTFSPYSSQELALALEYICSLSKSGFESLGRESCVIVSSFSPDSAANDLASYL